MSLSHLTAHHLRKAAKLIKKKEGFLEKVREIEQELEALALYGVLPKTFKADKARKSVKRKRRKISTAGRAKIAAAQKARWAKAKS
jgi:hypothetical protein